MKMVCQTNSLGARGVCAGGEGVAEGIPGGGNSKLGGNTVVCPGKGSSGGSCSARAAAARRLTPPGCAEDAFALCSGKVFLNRTVVIPSSMTKSV